VVVQQHPLAIGVKQQAGCGQVSREAAAVQGILVLVEELQDADTVFGLLGIRGEKARHDSPCPLDLQRVPGLGFLIANVNHG
jgi:hypothetical protein